MREIKFRGKRTDNDEWVYGYFYKGKRDDVENIPLGRHRIFWNIITPDGDIFEVIPDSVGEYTGLKDKEGKEIYEGDIIHVNSLDHRLYVIEWQRKTAEFLARRIDGGWYGFSSFSKIIGNIYENPDLLHEGVI